MRATKYLKEGFLSCFLNCFFLRQESTTKTLLILLWNFSIRIGAWTKATKYLKGFHPATSSTPLSIGNRWQNGLTITVVILSKNWSLNDSHQIFIKVFSQLPLHEEWITINHKNPGNSNYMLKKFTDLLLFKEWKIPNCKEWDRWCLKRGHWFGVIRQDKI